MAQEHRQVVRQPLTVGTSSRRRLEERIALSFPAASEAVGRLVWRLPPRSRLRQRSVRRFLRLGFEALNRGDYEVAFRLYHPDCETVTPAEFVALGFDPVYRGREGRIRFHEKWIAELGEFRNEPEELVDLGDRLLILVRVEGSGLTSGAGFENRGGYVLTLSAGQVIREDEFLDRSQALEAVGLSE